MCGSTCACSTCRSTFSERLRAPGRASRHTQQKIGSALLSSLGEQARHRGMPKAVSVIERMLAPGISPGAPGAPARMTQQRVNAARIWRQMAEHTYPNADLPFIATREALQNGIDAIRRLALFASWSKSESLEAARSLLGRSEDNPSAAPNAGIREGFPTVNGDREAKFREWLKSKEVRPERSKFLKEGKFEVTWDGASETLTWKDNGIGMTADILDEKFLVLGETGKSEAGLEGDVGGFGIAKAVILGVGAKGWRMRTRNVIAEPISGLDVSISITSDFYSGTEVTSFGVPGQARTMAGLGSDQPVEERVRFSIAASDVGDIKLVVDGEEIVPFFPKDRGTVLKQFNDMWWGTGTTVRIKRYRRAAGSQGGAFYVRLGGLLQFAQAPEGEMDSDIVLDVTTTARPESGDYPFTSSREQLRGSAAATFYSLRRKFAVDQQSSVEEADFEVFLPDATDPKERAGAQRIADQMAEMVDDPAYKALIADLLGQKMEAWAEASGGLPGKEWEGTTAPGVPEAAPTEREAGWGWVLKELPDKVDADTTDDVLAKTSQVIAHLADWAGTATGEGTSSLDRAAKQILNQGFVDSYTAEAALEDIHNIAKALGSSTDTTGPAIADTGLAAGAALGQIAKLIEDAVSRDKYASEQEIAEVKKKRSKINPFGTAALIKVSKANYDADMAKAFRRRAAKYIPMLVAWEAAGKLIALEYDRKLKAGGLGIKKKTFEHVEQKSWGKNVTSISQADIDRAVPPFRVGFILDDSVLAMAANVPGHGKFLLVQPDRLAEVVEHHKDRPWAIAGYLHATICHELAHLPRMGTGHNESYVIAREDLDVKTTHLLPVIERIIIRAFKLKTKVPPGAESAVRSAAWKATKAANDKAAVEIAKLKTEIASLQESGGGGPVAAEIAKLQEDIDYWSRKAKGWEDQYRDMQSEAEGATTRATKSEIAAYTLRTDLQTAKSRADAILQGVRDRAEPLLRALEGLAEYGEFRNFLMQHGHRFLPVPPAQFIASLESMDEAVDIVMSGLTPDA